MEAGKSAGRGNIHRQAEYVIFTAYAYELHIGFQPRKFGERQSVGYRRAYTWVFGANRAFAHSIINLVTPQFGTFTIAAKNTVKAVNTPVVREMTNEATFAGIRFAVTATLTFGKEFTTFATAYTVIQQAVGTT